MQSKLASRLIDLHAVRGAHGPAAWSVRPTDTHLLQRIERIDIDALTRYRLARLRAELRARRIGAALLSDPMNVFYATGMQNMTQWCLHSPGKYAFIATEGPVILFDYASTMAGNPKTATVDEVRPSTPWFFFLAGSRVDEKAGRWADEIADLVRHHCGDNRRLAVDRCDPWGAVRLAGHGLELVDVQGPMEIARCIKSAEEIECLRVSMAVADLAVERMRAALVPGISENQLWSVLHETNITHGGSWIECRLLSSGPRTNPWYQECGPRLIEAGDMVGFDTDMVGPLSYLADISRSVVCPGRRPTARQRELYALAQEQVEFNAALLRPGLGFRDFAERAWQVPDQYFPHRYTMLVHGVGMLDEYPCVVFPRDWGAWGYDGTFEENMVVSVESFIGEPGGAEGVKLEQQLLITAGGATAMSRHALEGALSLE